MEITIAKQLLLAAVREGDEDDVDDVHLPAAVLEKLALDDLPAGVRLGVGEHRNGVMQVDWEGALLRDGAEVRAEIDMSWTRKYWKESIALDYHLDLVRRAVEKRERTHGDVRVLLYDEDDEPWVKLVFEIAKLPLNSLGAAYRAADKLTDELMEPARAAALEAGRVIASAAQRLDGWGSTPFDAMVDAIDREKNANTKGRLLEELVARLFETVAGLTTVGRVRTATEEIDVTVLNASTDPRLVRESAILLVECKNWSSKCGKNEFVIFKSKLENRSERCTLGFLVSWNGLAETVSSEMLRGTRERTLVVPLTGADIRDAVRSGDFAKVLLSAWQIAVMT